jgi:hypothetical protein
MCEEVLQLEKDNREGLTLGKDWNPAQAARRLRECKAMDDKDSKPTLQVIAGGKDSGTKGKRTGKTQSGLTVKQEAFAQALASGASNSDAYRQSYDVSKMKDASIHTEASKLACNPAIASRVRAILDARQARNSMFTEKQREKHSDKIWRTLWSMIDAAETPPAVKANLLSLGAKAAGMLTEQVKIENISADSKSIEQELVERLQRLSKAG